MRTFYYFGVWDSHLGHFLHDRHGRVSFDKHRSLPFSVNMLDGGLMPDTARIGDKYMAVINGWTILSMPDQTGDKRGGSCSVFLTEGTTFTVDEMLEMARQFFPHIIERMRPILK